MDDGKALLVLEVIEKGRDDQEAYWHDEGRDEQGQGAEEDRNDRIEDGSRNGGMLHGLFHENDDQDPDFRDGLVDEPENPLHDEEGHHTGPLVFL